MAFDHCPDEGHRSRNMLGNDLRARTGARSNSHLPILGQTRARLGPRGECRNGQDGECGFPNVGYPSIDGGA